MEGNKWPIEYPIDEKAGYKCIYRKQEFHFDTREEALEFLHTHRGTLMISKYAGDSDK